MSNDAYDKLMKMKTENKKDAVIIELTEINNLIYINKNNINLYLIDIITLVNVINHSLIIYHESAFIKSMYTIMMQLIKITFALKNDKNMNGENYTYTSLHRYEYIINNILKIFLYYSNNKISNDFMYKIYYFIIKLSEVPERECIIFNLVVLVNNIVSCNNYLSIFATSNLKKKIESFYNNVIMNDTKSAIEFTVNKLVSSNPINPIQFMDGYTSNNAPKNPIQFMDGYTYNIAPTNNNNSQINNNNIAPINNNNIAPINNNNAQINNSAYFIMNIL